MTMNYVREYRVFTHIKNAKVHKQNRLHRAKPITECINVLPQSSLGAVEQVYMKYSGGIYIAPEDEAAKCTPPEPGGGVRLPRKLTKEWAHIS